jgi:hypothetical protein
MSAGGPSLRHVVGGSGAGYQHVPRTIQHQVHHIGETVLKLLGEVADGL